MRAASPSLMRAASHSTTAALSSAVGRFFCILRRHFAGADPLHDLQPLRRVFEADLRRELVDAEVALLRLLAMASEAMRLEVRVHLGIEGIGRGNFGGVRRGSGDQEQSKRGAAQRQEGQTVFIGSRRERSVGSGQDFDFRRLIAPPHPGNHGECTISIDADSSDETPSKSPHSCSRPSPTKTC